MSWGLVYNKSWLCHKHLSWLYAKGKHSENIQSTLKVKVKVTQSCPSLCDPMDYTIGGILQARILEWVAFPFSRGSSWPRNRTGVSCIAGRFFANWAIREAPIHFTEHQKRKFLWILFMNNCSCWLGHSLFTVKTWFNVHPIISKYLLALFPGNAE